MKRAVLYARTSTEGQKEEKTIGSQIDEVENQIEQDGNLITARYSDDGWSGELLARPDLDQMRDAARKHDFDVLYVYDRGRLARKFTYQELILDELSDLGIEFKTLHDVSAVTAEEKVLQSMQGVFHEYERVKIAERMRRGKQFKTKGGNLLGYNPLFGYQYVHKQGTINGYFSIDTAEAETVNKIFKWIGYDGYSILGVIKKLYEEKIRPPKGKRDFWVKSTIDRMVKNESYIGNHYYYKSQSAIPKNPKIKVGEYKKHKKSSRIRRPEEEWIKIKISPIIDEELFNKVQENLKLNSKFASRNKKGNYLLSSLVYCTCGMKRVGEKSADHLYYRCSDRIYSYPLPYKCKEKGIAARILDDLVYKKTLKLFKNEVLIKKQAKRWLESQNNVFDESKRQMAKIDEQLLRVQNEEERYLKVFGAGLSTFEVYEKRMKDLNLRKARLQSEKIKIESNVETNNKKPDTSLGDVCEKAIQTVKTFRQEDKQTFVRKIIDRVVANQAEALVRGYLPLVLEEIGEENVSFKLKDSYLRNSTPSKIGIGVKNVSFKFKDRDCRSSKRR